jgi:lambda repressor-like predicted transcriptional regulator
MSADTKFFQYIPQTADLAEKVVALVATTDTSLSSLSHTAGLLSKTLDKKADATKEYKDNFKLIADKMQSSCGLVQKLHAKLTGPSPELEEFSNNKAP